MTYYIAATSQEELKARIEAVADLDCWQNIDWDTEWANIPSSHWGDLWDRHIDERMIVVRNETMELCVEPVMSDDASEFIPGQVRIILEPVSWLAPQHRETIQETIDEILQAYGAGYWECDDWDELYEFGQDGVIVTLAGYEGE